MDVLDELLSGFSEEDTKEIELFFANNITDKKRQLEIVNLLNKARKNGAQAALDFYESSKTTLEKDNAKFMEDFQSKLKPDGPNDGVSK